MSLGGICDGPSVTALQQPQALSRCLWSRAPASAHAQRASSLRTVDLHPECCLCAAPWLVGVLRVPHSGCAVAVGTAEDSQPVPPPSLTASFRYPALARVVLVVWGEQRGLGGLGRGAVSLGGAEGDRQVGRAAFGAGCPTGLLLLPLFSPQGDPSRGPCLLFPPHFLGLAFLSLPSARKAQAL